MHTPRHHLFLTLAACLLVLLSQAQNRLLQGVVRDSHNEEPIPFASVEVFPDRQGVVTDSLGMFTIDLTGLKADSLFITYVGYVRKALYLPPLLSKSLLVVNLEREESGGVVVRSKVNWGLILWRKVVRHKVQNDRSRFSNYGYEVHNKLELDLNRINAEKLKEFKVLEPFQFILNNIDSSEGTPVLPIFLAETISDYYHTAKPKRSREEIKASKTNGIDNESVTKLLGNMYQNVNVYNNFIPVFDKQFVSPLSDNGDAYYNYRVADTVVLNGQRYFHWLFSPRSKGTNTFQGDAWIHDTSFAVQRISLRIDGSSNVNYIENLSIYQDFRLVNDSIWFLSKDKFIADIFPIGKNASGMKGRKTTTYRNVLVNSEEVLRQLARNKLQEEVVVLPGAEQKTESYWSDTRHEELNRNEQAIYHMIDTLRQMPLFKKYYNTLSFLTTGYKPIGNYEIGPWFNWISLNAWEGMRMRFDLGTTMGFHKNMYLHGYLAYGFGDQKFKGKAEMYYFFNKNPRKMLHVSYLNDIDNGQNYYDEVSLDNIFTLAIRKDGIPIKFMKIESQEIEYFTSNEEGWSLKLEAKRKIYNPLQNLPPASYFKSGAGDSLNNFETTVSVRFAYLERFLDGNYFRTSLGSDYPIAELRYSKGWSGVLNSNYDYHKINFRVNGYKKIAPWGSIDYSVYAGKIFGTLPYMLLDVAPGNEIYYYNKYAFNLMARYEYINDRYAGLSLEHNIGSGLFKYLGITRKLKWRQFWNVKTLWGGLTDANRELNFVPGHPFQDLQGKTYAEVGTGIDNIFKVLRFDAVWRLAPRPLPDNWVSKFGVFGSFRLAF
ncbi:MAG: DUF5686 and carboxypeptidase regulatory-like domain-containing protein [Chitinophagaceae bacterium]|jgi:hypothetical protein|nr:DUF5686 and carboxypeptidase regulatory-like domain-containing protein [Chitinophagaceae bacterium]